MNKAITLINNWSIEFPVISFKLDIFYLDEEQLNRYLNFKKQFIEELLDIEVESFIAEKVGNEIFIEAMVSEEVVTKEYGTWK